VKKLQTKQLNCEDCGSVKNARKKNSYKNWKERSKIPGYRLYDDRIKVGSFWVLILMIVATFAGVTW
jgi:hypothetical protein